MKLESMSKAQLEAHGRTVGIELDRRLVKSELISQLKDYISAQQIAEEMDLEAEDDDLDFMAQVLDPVVTEAELAAEMLAAMALQSATAATHEADVAQADIDYSRAVQSAKDARRMADQAVETQRQIEAQVLRVRQTVIEAQNASDEATRNSVVQAQLTASAVQAGKDAIEHEAMMLTAKTALSNM
jgi:hypothetical protein|tara:strand:+ start:93 stop:650 length:558 start_codon:yes stop_codon:yes gene_type:complete